MPTINQLVRQGRQNKTFKSKAPALGQRWNSLKKKETAQCSAKTWRLHPCWYNDTKET